MMRPYPVLRLLKVSLPVLIIPLLLSANSRAAEKPVWVEAQGEALLGETDTPKEVRDRSRKDALAKAVEKAAGVFLKSHTLVSNSQISDDLIFASVKGEVVKSHVIKAGWDAEDRNLYRTTVKALIRPVYPEKGEGFSAKLYISKARLKEGENVKVFYSANSDCHVYIFCVAADGSVTMLFPNAESRDNRAAANQAYEFPPPQSSINLKAMLLPGARPPTEEKIKIIATRSRQDLIPLGFQEGTFQVYTAQSTGMISDLVRKLNHLEPHEWTEATAVYTIVK